MVDLLQVETVPAPPRRERAAPEQAPDGEREDKAFEDGAAPSPPAVVPETMDAEPTSKNTKFPPLRRAALHFLTLLIQACTERLYDSGANDALAFPARLLRRAKTTLGYVAATDADGIVRVMAREAQEGLEQLGEAMVGV